MTIKQQGGIFGRNPSFKSIELDGTDLETTLDAKADLVGDTFTGQVNINTSTTGGLTVTAAGNGEIISSRTSGASVKMQAQSAAGTLGTTSNHRFDLLSNGAARLRIDTNANVTVMSGNLVIGTSGKGIDFSATSGTGTSELFDDYEEGTWTPEITGTSTAGTIAYNAQHGYYTKIGRMVQVEFYVQWNSGTGTGNLQITGLPFTAGNNLTQPGLAIGDIENVALTAANVATLAVASNSTNINMRQVPTGGGGSSPVPYDAAGYIKASGVYSV